VEQLTFAELEELKEGIASVDESGGNWYVPINWSKYGPLLVAIAEDSLHVTQALNEVQAPTSSGGFELAPAGRLRALRSQLVIEANQLRGQRADLVQALEAIAQMTHSSLGTHSERVGQLARAALTKAQTASIPPTQITTRLQPTDGSSLLADLQNELVQSAQQLLESMAGQDHQMVAADAGQVRVELHALGLALFSLATPIPNRVLKPLNALTSAARDLVDSLADGNADMAANDAAHLRTLLAPFLPPVPGEEAEPSLSEV
jgi:hypothetical protein